MRMRPGSLTALAVLNFTGAAFCSLGALALTLRLLIPRRRHRPQQEFLPEWFVPSEITAFLVIAALMVAAGIGYLRQSRWLGRGVGTIYACTALTWAGVVMTVLHQNKHLADVGLMTLVGALLPLATLVWLHLIVRDVWSPLPPIQSVAGTSGSALQPGWLKRLVLHTAYSLRQSLRGAGGLVLILVMLALGLVAVQIMTAIDRVGGERLRGLYPLGLGSLLRGFFQADNDLTIDYAGWALHLAIDQVPVVSCCWLLLLALVPFLATFGTFNLVAADAQRRGFRYLLLRSDRTSIYLGRFAASAVLSSVVWFLLLAIASTYLGLTVTGVAWRPLMLDALWCWATCSITALPYLALTAAFSTVIPSGLGALVLATVAIGMVPGLAFALSTLWTPLWHVMHALPWGVQFLLLHPSPTVVAAAAAACLGYTVIFLWVGLHCFQRRDL